MIMKSDLQAVLEELRIEDQATRGEPPTVEEMLAYRNGELSAEEETRVRELLICWPELLRALMTPYPDDDANALPPEIVERQWTAMRRQMGRSSSGRVLSFRNALTAIAATLAVVFGGLLWQARLELRRPRALPQQELIPGGMRGSQQPVTTLAQSADGYLLQPNVSSDQTFESYRFELEDSRNPPRRMWQTTAVRRRDDDTFVLFVPHLAEGTYKLIVYGVNGERKEQLETYTMRVLRR